MKRPSKSSTALSPSAVPATATSIYARRRHVLAMGEVREKVGTHALRGHHAAHYHVTTIYARRGAQAIVAISSRSLL